MPHITTERVSEIRSQLKKEFPGYQFSITRRNHSTVSVSIMEAPFNLLLESEKGNESVNHYHIHETYKDHPEIMAVLSRIYEIMNAGNGTLTEDGDYGTVPKFYTDLSVGKWDKPFQVVAPKIQPVFEKQEIVTGEVQIIEYSEKAIAVIGDTRPIKDKLKELGGKFNPRLTCGCGWIFPKTKLEVLTAALAA